MADKISEENRCQHTNHEGDQCVKEKDHDGWHHDGRLMDIPKHSHQYEYKRQQCGTLTVEDWFCTICHKSKGEIKMVKKKIICSNCGKKVKYGSEHCRGNDEIHAYWICKKKG